MSESKIEQVEIQLTVTIETRGEYRRGNWHNPPEYPEFEVLEAICEDRNVYVIDGDGAIKIPEHVVIDKLNRANQE